MSGLIVDLVGKGVLLPLLLSFVLTGVVRICLGRPNGPLLAAIGIAAAVGISYAVLFGWPVFPPRSAAQKVAYLSVFGLILGLMLDLRGDGKAAAWLASIVWPAVIVGWLGWRQLNAPTTETIISLGIVWIAGIFVCAMLFRDRGPRPNSAILLLVSAVGAALITLFGASGSVGQMYGILAAATGGFLLWNWPVPRFPFAGLGTIGGGGILIALATQTVLFTNASKIAMGILLLVFISPLVLSRWQMAGRPVVGPIVLGVTAAIPALVAAIIAFILTGEAFESPI